MAAMSELRIQAKKAGIPAKAIRECDTPAELQALISSHAKASNGTKKKGVAKKAVAKATKKTTTTEAPKKRGRPKGSTNKSTSAKSKPAVKSTTGKAKRSTAGENGGRHLLGKIKWSATDGWNPREGSVPDVIVKALRKAKGDREAAFKALSSKLDSLVTKKTRNGRTRSKDERREYLRYLISRNAWAFAIATGQHEKSAERAEYGTAGTGQGVFKRAKGTAKKTAKAEAPKKRGRPAGSKNRKAADAPKKRGRPKGSKNKTTTKKVDPKKAGRKAAKKK